MKKTLEKIKDFYNRTIPLRYKRVRNYIRFIEENYKLEENVSEKSLKLLEEIKDKINKKIIQIRSVVALNIFFYLGAYFTFVSIFFSDIFLLSEIAILISTLVSIFGTTAFIVGIFLTNRVILAHYEDLNLLATHYMILYTEVGIPSDEFGTDSLIERLANFFEHKRKGE